MTYSFTNGTTADASQVNTNYTDLINGLSDGTKDLNVNAFTAAGAATLNGNVTLGNSSSDTLTVTASLGSSISIDTNATYNVGGSTTGLASIYLGNNTRTVRLVAGTLTGSYTITLPAATAATGQIMVFNSSSTAEFRYPEKFTAAKTSNYTATGDETIIPVTCTGGAVTITLPAASTMTGKRLTIFRTDTTLANALTIDANSTETITGGHGATETVKMWTAGESLDLACDGTGWYVTNHVSETKWNDFASLAAGTLITSTTGNPTYGTGTTHWARWRRVGNIMHVNWHYSQTGAGTDSAAGMYLFNLPSGVTIDTSVVTVNTGSSPQAANIKGKVGDYIMSDEVNGIGSGSVLAYSTTAVKFMHVENIVSSGQAAGNAWQDGQAGDFSATNMGFSANMQIPITDWLP